MRFLLALLLITSPGFLSAQQPKLILPVGHTAPIASYVVTKDGKYLVTGSNDRTAKIWNFRTGKLMFDLTLHTGRIIKVLLCEDDQSVVLASSDGSYSKWEIKTGKLLYHSKVKASIIDAYLIRNDSIIVLIKKDLITIGGFQPGGYEQIMNETLEFGNGTRPHVTALSTDKKVMAIRKPNGSMEFFDLEEMKYTGSNSRVYIDSIRYYDLEDRVADLFFISNDTLVGVFDRTMIASFDTTGKQLSFRFQNISSYTVNESLTKMAFRSDRDDTVRVMDLKTFTILHQFSDPKKNWLIGWRKDTILMQASTGLQFVDITGKLLTSTKWEKSLTKVFPLAGNSTLLTNTQTGIEKRDFNSGKLAFAFTGMIPPLQKAVYSGASKWMFEIKESHANYWDLDLLKVNRLPLYNKETVKNVFHTSERDKVLLQFTTQLQLYDLEKATVIKEMEINYDCKIKVSQTGESFFTTSENWLMKWNITALNSLGAWEMPHNIKGWTLSPDEKLFAYHVSDGTEDSAHIWILDSSRKLASLPRPGQYIEKGYLVVYTPNYTPLMQISKDNRYLFFSSGDRGWISIARLPPIHKENEEEEFEQAELVYEEGTLEMYTEYYPIAVDQTRKILFLTSDHETGKGSILARPYEENISPFEDRKDNSRKQYRLEYSDFQRILHLDETNQILYTATDKEWLTWDLKSRKLIKKEDFKDGMVPRGFDTISKKVLTTSTAGIGLLGEGNQQQYYFYTLAENEKVVYRGDGYYTADPSANRYFSWNIEDRFYDFDQWDLQYNRPDKILEISGDNSGALIQAYRNAYEKRLKKNKSTTIRGAEPSIRILNNEPDGEHLSTRDFVLKLEMQTNTKKSKVQTVRVSINGNPLFGADGLKIEGNEKIKEVPVQLSMGENQIKVSCVDNKGRESIREQRILFYDGEPAREPVTYFIGIGIDRFADKAQDLNWCVKDIHDLVTELSKNTKGKLVVDTIFNEKVSVESINAIRQKLLASGVDDKVIIAYSGHGMLSKNFDYYLSTYAVDFKNPEIGGLPYQAFESLLDGIPARKKLVLLDACHSGEVDKEDLEQMDWKDSTLAKSGLKSSRQPVAREGALGMKSSFELMQELFLTVSMNTGAMVIAAAGGTQFAQERAGLANGVFTYSVLEFIREQQDASVNLLKKYVSRRVTELTHGLQVPTTRSEVMVDWKLF